MDNKEVTQEQEVNLLSVEQLKAKNELLEKRVKTLETQVQDMINELKTGSYTVIDENGNNMASNKEKLEGKVKKVFGNGKTN